MKIKMLGHIKELLFFVLIALLLQLHFSCSNNKKNNASVLFANESSGEILKGKLNVCGQEFDVANLKPRQNIEFQFKVYSECGYSVRVELESGKILEKETGYFDGAMTDVKDRIVITDSEIKLENLEVTLKSHFGKSVHHNFSKS